MKIPFIDGYNKLSRNLDSIASECWSRGKSEGMIFHANKQDKAILDEEFEEDVKEFITAYGVIKILCE